MTHIPQSTMRRAEQAAWDAYDQESLQTTARPHSRSIRLMPSHLHEEVAALYRSGLTPTRIADRLGRPPQSIYNALNRARCRGLLSPAPRKPRELIPFHLRNRDRKLGSVRALFSLLTEAEAEWLFAQVPAGAAVAEVLAAMVRDAYEEEHENT